ncbi:hypothetical protein, partial [Staphylococcus delphini]
QENNSINFYPIHAHFPTVLKSLMNMQSMYSLRLNFFKPHPLVYTTKYSKGAEESYIPAPLHQNE